MQKLVETNESAFEQLAGKTITCLCINYFYTGQLIGVNETSILLKNPKIIYETGEWSASDWKDAQEVCGELFINISAIESFGVIK